MGEGGQLFSHEKLLSNDLIRVRLSPQLSKITQLTFPERPPLFVYLQTSIGRVSKHNVDGSNNSQLLKAIMRLLTAIMLAKCVPAFLELNWNKRFRDKRQN